MKKPALPLALRQISGWIAAMLRIGFAVFATLIAGSVQAATAIKCTGVAGADFRDPINMTRTYIIDDTAQTVSLYNSASGGKIPICGKCAKDFGSNSIRLIQKYTGFWEELRIDREIGSFWYYLSAKGVQGQYFQGACQKSEIPKTITRKRKF